MSLSVGIVGLPNVGKSTMFNALLSRRQAPVGSHPFTTVKPNTGVVRLPDVRLEKLAKHIKPEKTTPASVTFVDIAGLVKGAHQGEGLGNEFLSHIRSVDVICHVVREFDSPSVTHVMETVEPLRDKEIILTELMLKDLETLERAQDSKKVSPPLKSATEKLISALDRNEQLDSVSLTQEERGAIQPLQLISVKPMFYVLNVAEGDLESLKDEVKKLSLKLDNCVVVSAKLEEELIDLDEKERASYRRELGLRGASLDRLISKAYGLLQLITFYTVKGAGGKTGEVRAWSLRQGKTVLDAAETVHSDFAKRFVTAEVIDVNTLLSHSSWKSARDDGKIRTEGKAYVVRDGDVIEVKAAV